MAAYVNHSLTHYISGNGSNIQGHTSGGSSVVQDSSPLQIFVKAKKKINDIFVEIQDYVQDTVLYMTLLQQHKDVPLTDEDSQVKSYVGKVKGICEVLSRDHMKVAFFGRTSNGKSTVINAMLREKILPSGIGHTTNCFVQVEGSKTGESFLFTEGSSDKQNVQSVGQLGHALCKEKLTENNLVQIFWPKEKCALLRDDVVLVDSPGIDISPNFDEWIDKHCLDADVFVLVANAESTLMQAEKKFFHKVSQRLSKPNIFILNNRWDASASEVEYMSQVKVQHMERAVDFLVKELKVCSQKEATDRIFFVSAKEVLQARLQEQKGFPLHTGALAEGFQNRYFEFQDFERKFEECISKSAVQTKFGQHSERGKFVASEIHSILNGIYETAQKIKHEKTVCKKEVQDKLAFTEQQLLLLTQEMKDKIHQLVEEVEQRVSKALSEEIHRLSVLVDDFNLPFHPEPLVLNVYKRELHSHVENGLGSNLRARLSSSLAVNIENSQREMAERMTAVLPIDKKQVSLNMISRREPFEILYRLNCDNLCADFREDLEFKFSWGITALISRFCGKESSRIAIANNMARVPPALLSPSDNVDFSSVRYLPPQISDDWSLWSSVSRASVGSQGTMGCLLVAGFLLKTVGWRLIVITGAVYCCFYLYERLTWTNKAKERTFKEQYVAHATRKLRLIVDLTSANCSHQVQQELSSSFACLCHLVDDATNDTKSELKNVEVELKRLEEAANFAKILRNKANYIIKELEIFEEAYLKSQNK